MKTITQCALALIVMASSACTTNSTRGTTQSNAPLATNSHANNVPSLTRVRYNSTFSSLADILKTLKLIPEKFSALTVTTSSFPSGSLYSNGLTHNPVSVPLEVQGEIVLQLKPDLKPKDIDDLLMSYDASPVFTIPQIGVIVLQVRDADAPRSISGISGVRSLRLFKLMAALRNDPRVLAVAPNSFLSTSLLRTAVVAVPQANRSLALKGEQEDWGMADAHIPQEWSRLTMHVRIGVIDVGFGTNSDVRVVNGLATPLGVDNHGMHVSGIMCAEHNNREVRGVLPNCTVVAAVSRDLLGTSILQQKGHIVTAWSAAFAEYLGTVIDFMDANPDVKTINLSLGYNWATSFNKDPRQDADVRDIVEGEGRIFESVLELAAQRGVALVSAAGNDSESLSTPLDAQWASPFNFGSRLMRLVRGWSNGLVVEAHDRSGRRASFSNIGGDISCPGVDVLSTVAEPANSIATMSGTSMATPYCASALAALRMIRPELGLRTAIRCLRLSKRSNGDAPILNLQYAVANCTSARAGTTAEQLASIGHLADYLASATGDPRTEYGGHECTYLPREVLAVQPVRGDFDADGQIPEIPTNTRLKVRAFARRLLVRRCSGPVLVVTSMAIGPFGNSVFRFAYSVMSEIDRAGYRGGAMILEWPDFGLPIGTDTGTPAYDKILLMTGDIRMRQGIYAGLGEIRRP